MITRREFYIGGRWVAPATARDQAVIDPSTEEPCAVISLGSEADADAAVAVARAALSGWATTPLADRRAIVARILDEYERRKEDLAQAIAMEMGAPIDMAKDSQAPCLPWHLKNFWAPSTRSSGSGRLARTRRTTGSRCSRSALSG